MQTRAWTPDLTGTISPSLSKHGPKPFRASPLQKQNSQPNALPPGLLCEWNIPAHAHHLKLRNLRHAPRHLHRGAQPTAALPNSCNLSPTILAPTHHIPLLPFYALLPLRIARYRNGESLCSSSFSHAVHQHITVFAFVPLLNPLLRLPPSPFASPLSTMFT